jgi:hypothetical protein
MATFFELPLHKQRSLLKEVSKARKEILQFIARAASDGDLLRWSEELVLRTQTSPPSKKSKADPKKISQDSKAKVKPDTCSPESRKNAKEGRVAVARPNDGGSVGYATQYHWQTPC